MSLFQWIRARYISLISFALGFNEQLVFYPKLRRYYKKQGSLANVKLTILDVGANKGQSIKFFKNLFPSSQLFAIEPNSKLCTHLRKNFESKTTCIHELGFSSEKGIKLFHEHLLNETSSFESLNIKSAYAKKKSAVLLTSPNGLIKGSYPVEVSTIDDFLQDYDLTSLDILKIDVEGHEYEVLKGAMNVLASNLIKYIQLEEHADDQYAQRENNPSKLLNTFDFHECSRIKHGFGNFFEVIYKKH